MVQDLVAWKSTSRIYNIKLSFSFFHFPHSKFSNERHRNGKIDSIFPLSFIWRDKTVFQGLIFNIFIVVPCVKIVKNLSLYYPIYILSTSCLHTHTNTKCFQEGSWLVFEKWKNERNRECQFPNFSTFQKETNDYKNSFVLESAFVNAMLKSQVWMIRLRHVVCGVISWGKYHKEMRMSVV